MSGRQYQVIISPEAITMFSEYVSFLARVSKDAAESLRHDFVSQVESLKQMPQRCPWLDGGYIPYRKYHKLIFKKHYAMIYQVAEEEQTVYIDFVIDFRKDYRLLFI